MKKKENLSFINAENLVEGVDFEVVTDTPFKKDQVFHFFKYTEHEIDEELATMLGFGVVRSLHFENDFYLYNASDDEYDDFGLMNEITRVEVYYQITHPNYYNKELEEFIIGTERGKLFLQKLLTVDSEIPYERLKAAFEIQRSKMGRVIPFKQLQRE